MKTALITGISGQDGFFLSRLLLQQGYDVHGFIRRNSQASVGTLESLSDSERKKITIHWGDISDHTIVESVVREGQYNEIYHLAAQSFVWLSFTNPSATYQTNIDGTLNLVNAIKTFSPQSKFYFAGTSEMFGKSPAPQNETTPFYPRSPYGISKLAAYWTTKNYRESYQLFMSNGILFNHESEMRGAEFVTRKITQGVASIANGSTEPLILGNLDAKRDWGYATDYTEAMWRILQHHEPDDFVIATGISHTVREFVEQAFLGIGITIAWEGTGVSETGKNAKDGRLLVQIDQKLYRPAEVDDIRGDAQKAKNLLRWEPTVSFEELVAVMVKTDLARIKHP